MVKPRFFRLGDNTICLSGIREVGVYGDRVSVVYYDGYRTDEEYGGDEETANETYNNLVDLLEDKHG